MVGPNDREREVRQREREADEALRAADELFARSVRSSAPLTPLNDPMAPSRKRKALDLAMVLTAAFGMGIGIAVLGQSRTGGTTSGGCTYAAPNTPTISSLTVVDDSTVWAQGGSFVGSCDDTQDSIRFGIARVGQDSANFVASVRSGAQQRDTIIDPDSLKVDTTYVAFLSYKGAAAKSATWSAWSAPDTFVMATIPSPSGTIRLDTRSGGAQDIQAAGVTTLAAALSASGFTEYPSANGGALAFTTDADGAGAHAFRFDWPGVAAATEVHTGIYRSVSSVTAAETYLQWQVWQSKTASGGGIGTAGSWDCCSQGPGSGKRLVWFRSTGGNTGRITYAPGTSSGTGQLFIETAYNPATATTNVNWDSYVSQWITITVRLVPESGVGAGDGEFTFWFNGTQTHEVTSATTYSTALGGELQIGGPTWIGVPQDQSMYVKDIVVWQP